MEATEDPTINKKRKHEDEVDIVEPSPKRVISETAFNLIDFSDEMLLAILKHLDSPSLIKLSRTCTRLRTLAQDHTHWVNVDFTSKPISCSQLLHFLFRDVCQPGEIRTLKVRGQVSLYPLDKWKNQTVTENLIEKLSVKCPKMESLCIQDAYVDSNKVGIVNFPATLKSITLNNCHLSVNHNPRSSFFSKINFHLKNLEKLAVEHCNWFDTHDLIAFSKIPNLKYLSLRGCKSFKDCVPYGSIATRFGFQTLEVLDVRETPVSDSDIQCFNMTKSLKELRLQCPKMPEKPEEEHPETENVSEGDRPGTSGEVPTASSSSNTEPKPPNPISASVHVRTDRQVINLHLRPSRNNGRMEAVRDHHHHNEEAPHHQQPLNLDFNEHRQHQQQPDGEGEDDDEEIQEAGAEFNSGNNNVRINIRNQNVQGRNVIHIVLQNNHTCNRNENQNNAENEGDVNQEGNEANREEPAGEAAPPQNNAENQDNAPLNANEQNLADGGVQHYIMIRGIREGAENENEVNPARIVHPALSPEICARIAHTNPYRFYDRFIQFQRSHPLNMTQGPLNLAITDRGICSFGHSRNNANGGLVWIRMEQRSPTTQLESITVRDYKMVTDIALQHLSSCAPRLKFLDVIGTEVTQDGIEKFKLQKPECRVISNFGVSEEENNLC